MKKYINICLLTLITVIISCTESTSPDSNDEENDPGIGIEYTIYSHMLNYLNTIGDYSNILLCDSTVRMDITDMYEYIQSHFDSIEIETLDNFQLHNLEREKLQGIDSLTLQYTFIKDNEVTNWEDNYPEAICVFHLSRVGYNSDQSQALVYFSEYYGYLAASGNLVYLEKEEDWIVKKILMLWIS